MSQPVTILPLSNQPAVIAALTDLLVGTVAAGGSVSFMHPLDPGRAAEFWLGSLAAADRSERIVFGAYDGEELIGTVTLLLDCPPNQPHRAEIAKLMTLVSRRRQGIGKALVKEAERKAVELGKTLLNLDTATEDGAATLYEGLGFQRAGEIPDYAYKPHGGLTGTLIYWKRIGKSPGAD